MGTLLQKWWCCFGNLGVSRKKSTFTAQSAAINVDAKLTLVTTSQPDISYGCRFDDKFMEIVLHTGPVNPVLSASQACGIGRCVLVTDLVCALPDASWVNDWRVWCGGLLLNLVFYCWKCWVRISAGLPIVLIEVFVVAHSLLVMTRIESQIGHDCSIINP